VLPADAGKHSICARSLRGSVELCAAICPRYGSATGGEIRGYVCQPLHRGLWGARAKGRTEAARFGARSRADPAPRSARVCPVKSFFLLSLATLFTVAQAQDADPKQRARSVRDLAKQGRDAISRIAPFF